MYVCKKLGLQIFKAYKFAIVRMHTCITMRYIALSAYIYLYGHMCECV